MHNQPNLRPPPSAEQPALTVDPAHLDFGEVWETDKFEWSAPVRNHTDSSLLVSAYSSSCSCVSASSTKLIPANTTAPLTFRVDLRAVACAGTMPQALRDTKIQVSLRGDTAPEKPVAVELRGRVKSAIAVPMRTVDFGRLALNTSKSRVLSLHELVGLKELNAVPGTASVLAELKPISPGKWELHLRPTATAVAGRHETAVQLVPVTSSGERVPPITIAVVYDVLPDIQADSPFVALGTGRVGETLRGTFTVASASGRPFAPPTCEGATRSPASAAPQSSYTFHIERAIPAHGNQSVPLVVRGRDADGQPFEVRVEVQSYGVSP